MPLSHIKEVLTISLRDSPRRQVMMEHFEEIGLTKECVCSFVDGVKVTNKQELFEHQVQFMDILSENVIDCPLMHKIGDMGCLLAHLKACKYIIDNNIEYALVLEDDVVIYDMDRLKSTEEVLCKYNFTFVHPVFSFGAQGQVVSLNAAKQLWELRHAILACGQPWDLILWHKGIPFNFAVTNLPFVKHRVSFNDPNTSERIQLNNSVSSL